jgi:hypothetical protein
MSYTLKDDDDDDDDDDDNFLHRLHCHGPVRWM